MSKVFFGLATLNLHPNEARAGGGVPKTPSSLCRCAEDGFIDNILPAHLAGELINLVSDIGLGTPATQAKDILGSVYECDASPGIIGATKRALYRE